MAHDYTGIQELLLELADDRPPNAVLELVVERLGAEPYIGLAGAWLRGDGALRLAAHAGRAAALADALRQVPLGEHPPEHPLGRAGTGQSVNAEPGTLIPPDRAQAEGLVGFGAEPLVRGGDTLGVLGVFTRAALGDALPALLRLVADHTAAALANARTRADIDRHLDRLRRERHHLRGFAGIVGTSAATRSLRRRIDLAAATDAPVLIVGEPGTGKALAAHEIHRNSARRDAPLIAIDGRALSGDELTPLTTSDTLVIERVDSAPSHAQLALERSLETIDARVIATARSDRFRESLVYALGTFTIAIPPLRERVEDIAALATHFAEGIATRHGVPCPRFPRADIAALAHHPWPQNAHALRNAVERAVLATATGMPPRLTVPRDLVDDDILADTEIRRLERDNIARALMRADGKLYGSGGAAEMLGVKPTTLAHRIEAMGIRRPRRRSVR